MLFVYFLIINNLCQNSQLWVYRDSITFVCLGVACLGGAPNYTGTPWLMNSFKNQLQCMSYLKTYYYITKITENHTSLKNNVNQKKREMQILTQG